MTLDLQPIIVWITAALTVINFLTIIKNALSSTSKENAADIKGHTHKLTEHDRRIQTIEGEMKHLPDRESQHRMELAMAAINGRLDTLNETLKPIKATNERINELLVEQVKK